MIHRTPFFLPWFYPSLVWRMPTREKVLYLTFDDGPVPGPTEFALHTLGRFDALATFFCIGDNIRKYPQVFRKVVDDGHAIGNHTFNHLNGWKTNVERYVGNTKECSDEIVLKINAQEARNRELEARAENAEIRSKEQEVRSKRQGAGSSQHPGEKHIFTDTSSLVLDAGSLAPNLFRPPYGRITRTQMKRLPTYSIIMWDVLSMDYNKFLSPDACLRNTISACRPGSIIVFHDSYKAERNMMYALPRLMEHFCEAGYTFKSIQK
jgi:peptidoglycan/xylan/chitin deacetylase (PgdA/CDA1 family)